MLGKENEERRENHVRELPGHHDDQGGGRPPHREREDGQQARFRRQDQELPDRKGPALHQEPGQGVRLRAKRRRILPRHRENGARRRGKAPSVPLCGDE